MGVDPKGPITAGHRVSTYLHTVGPHIDFDHPLAELWPIYKSQHGKKLYLSQL